jgi:hypothetical protein
MRRSQRVRDLERHAPPLEGDLSLGEWFLPCPERQVEFDVLDRELCVHADYAGGENRGAPTGALAELEQLDGARAEDRATWDHLSRFVRNYGLLLVDTRRGQRSRWRSDERCYVGGGIYREPIRWYLEYARLLAATRRASWRLQEQRNPDREDLRAIAEFLQGRVSLYRVASRHEDAMEFALDAPPGASARREWLAYQGGRIGAVVEWWLTEGQVRQSLTWTPSLEPRTLWTGGLWGSIGGELLASLCRGSPGPTCHACGRKVRRKSRPKRGQEVWCTRPQCTKAAAAYWTAEHRRRKRDAAALP